MARTRPRQPGPIKRTIVPPAPAPLPSTVAMLRSPAPPVAAVHVRRSTALRMTGAQRDSTGKRSDWNRAASLRPWTTPMIAAWSPTATTMPRGGVVDPTAYPTPR